jgi:purine-binding chemotaxis protein CheW
MGEIGIADEVKYLAFTVDGGRYALALDDVERVLPAAAPTHLPHAPALVLGVLDLAGRALPVLDVRQRFALPGRAIEPSDRLIVTKIPGRAVILLVDAVEGVLAVPRERVIAGATVLPKLEYIQGLVRLDDGLVLIHDLETFLSLDDVRALDEALADSEERA